MWIVILGVGNKRREKADRGCWRVLVPAEEDLDLTELSLDSEFCCQLSYRVTAANVADFGELLELVFGNWVLLRLLYYRWLGHITSDRPYSMLLARARHLANR